MPINPISGFEPYIPPLSEIGDNEPVKPARKVVAQKDTLGSATEHYLNLALINAFTSQRINYEESAFFATQSAKETHEISQALRKAINDEYADYIKMQSRVDKLKICGEVTTAGAILTGVVTAGLALLLGITSPGLAIAGGLLGITSGVFKYLEGSTRQESGLLQAEILGSGEKRKKNHTQSLNHLENQTHSQNRSFETFKTLSENEKRKYDTARAVIGGIR